jgi:exonuclease VII large subunit
VESSLLALFARQAKELVKMLTGAEQGMRNAFLFANAELAVLHGTVQALDGDALLSRGFVLAVRPDGTFVTNAAEAAALDTFSLLFADDALAVAATKPTKASVH